MAMLRRICWGAATALGIALVSSVPAGGQEPGLYGLPLDREQLEEYLRVAKVVHREPIGTGVTGSKRVTLTDGTHTLRAAWKTIDEHKTGLWRGGRGGLQFDFRDSWKHEVAAYELDKLLGLGLVPPTVRRRIDGTKGSVQLWLEDMINELQRQDRGLTPERPRQKIRWGNQVHCVRLLHRLTYNTDYLNGENVLIDADFGLHAIDFSRAFRIQHEILAPDALVCFSRRAVERLEQLDRAIIEERMGDLLDDMQIDGLLARRDRILKLIRSRIDEKGPGPTLFY
jgi:hypothetical protein